MTYQLQQGTPLQPANQSYQSYNLTSNLQLSWPFSFLAAENVVANIMDFNATGAYTVTLPNATEASTGQSFIFNNLSSFTLTLTTYENLTPFTIPAGERWYFYLIDNSTPDGVWNTVIYGSGSSNPDANALAGLGLVVLPDLNPPNLNVLNTNVVTSVKTLNFSPELVDRASLVVVPSGGTLTNIELNANVLNPGFYFTVLNEGNTPFTVTATGGTINGSTLPFPVDASGYFTFVLQSTGVWNAFGVGFPIGQTVTSVTIDITGGDVYLSAAQANAEIVILVGTLAANTIVGFPLQTDTWIVISLVDTTNFSLNLVAYTPGPTPVGDPISLFTEEHTQIIADPSLGTLTPVAGTNPVVSVYLFGGTGTALIPSIQVASLNPQALSNTGLYYDDTSQPTLGFSVAGVSQAALTSTGILAVNNLEASGNILSIGTTQADSGFIGPNVPPDIATSPLGAAVVNALISGNNQAILGGLSILQIVSGSNDVSTVGSLLEDLEAVSLSLNLINPNSKILIMGNIVGTCGGSSSYSSFLLGRTPSFALDQGFGFAMAGTDLALGFPIFYIDTPNLPASSSLTYTSYIRPAGPGPIPYLNRSLTANGFHNQSWLIAIEIGGYA